MQAMRAITCFDDDGEYIRKNQVFHRSRFKAQDLERLGLAVLLNDSATIESKSFPKLAPGKRLPVSPAGLVSQKQTAKKSRSGATNRGNKQARKNK